MGVSLPARKDAMYLDIDPQKCTECLACEVFCSLQHEGFVNPQLSRIQVFHNEERTVIVPITCVPCDKKPCIAACPEGAIAMNDRGAVIISESLCTGCGKCAHACEIGAIRVHRLEGRGKNGHLVSLKCDQCEGDPWCVHACSPGAIRKVEDLSGGQVVHDRLKEAKEPLQKELEKAGVVKPRRAQ